MRARRASSRAIPRRQRGLGGIEDFLREYSLSTREGLALMVLAEALLRVPDSATADRLIEDKLFLRRLDPPRGEVVRAARLGLGWALGLSARIIQPGETPENILESLGKRLGLPAVRTGRGRRCGFSGPTSCWVQSIEEALARAAHHREFRYSYDMLGEGAAHSGRRGALLPKLRPGDSSDRSDRRQCAPPGPAGHFGQALGPASALRGGFTRAGVLRELTPRVLELARHAKGA